MAPGDREVGPGGPALGLPWFIDTAGRDPTVGLHPNHAMLLAQIAQQTVHTVTQNGIGLGAAIAVVCSWQRNRSILWAILAGVLSWLYVIYFALTRDEQDFRR